MSWGVIFNFKIKESNSHKLSWEHGKGKEEKEDA